MKYRFNPASDKYFIKSMKISDPTTFNHFTWEFKFCIFPKRCGYSKKLLWLTHAYHGTRYYSWLGTQIEEWISAEEYLLSVLKHSNSSST